MKTPGPAHSFDLMNNTWGGIDFSARRPESDPFEGLFLLLGPFKLNFVRRSSAAKALSLVNLYYVCVCVCVCLSGCSNVSQEFSEDNGEWKENLDKRVRFRFQIFLRFVAGFVWEIGRFCVRWNMKIDK